MRKSGYVVEIDEFLRARMGKPLLEGEELELQRVVWMADSNMGMVAELNAIFLARFMFVIFEQDKYVIGLIKVELSIVLLGKLILR